MATKSLIYIILALMLGIILFVIIMKVRNAALG